MVPAGLQAGIIGLGLTELSVWGELPFKFSLSKTERVGTTIERPSGDQAAWAAPSVPGIGCGWTESIGRIHRLREPSAFVAPKMIRDPSGEMLGKSTVPQEVSSGGGIS